MNWKPINMPVLDPRTAEKTKTAFAGLTRRASKLQTDRSKYDSEASAIRETPPEKMDAKFAEKRDSLRLTAMKLLAEEVELRGDLMEFFSGPYSQELVRIHDEVCKAMPLVEKDIRARLVSIGYVDTPNLGERGSILPMFVMRHPEFAAARENVNGVGGLPLAGHRLGEQMQAAIDVAKQEMERLRQSQLSGI